MMYKAIIRDRRAHGVVRRGEWPTRPRCCRRLFQSTLVDQKKKKKRHTVGMAL